MGFSTVVLIFVCVRCFEASQDRILVIDNEHSIMIFSEKSDRTRSMQAYLYMCACF